MAIAMVGMAMLTVMAVQPGETIIYDARDATVVKVIITGNKGYPQWML